ncbi:DUF6624 domain-containing protein [Streptomyces nodosus]|uniref:DUF6624 domain-containing protein n=1 Tax=Streptomyces nodosus TaxID=40318 RepID=UPI0038080B82
MSIAEPLQPDLARELLVRAEQASDNWARRVRNELDAIGLGQSRRADHVNAKMLTRVLADHGWPGHRLVGPDACRAAWRLALHADDQPDLQRTAARLLHRAAQAGDASIQHWAHLQDRALINSRIPQEFGTQYRPGPHGVEPYPTRAPDTLATRRESVGLPSPAAALEALRERLSATPNHGTNDDTVLLTVLTGAA